MENAKKIFDQKLENVLLKCVERYEKLNAQGAYIGETNFVAQTGIKSLSKMFEKYFPDLQHVVSTTILKNGKSYFIEVCQPNKNFLTNFVVEFDFDFKIYIDEDGEFGQDVFIIQLEQEPHRGKAIIAPYATDKGCFIPIECLARAKEPNGTKLEFWSVMHNDKKRIIEFKFK